MFSLPKASELPKLSPTEESNPLAQFYYQGAVQPDPAVMAQIDPEKPMEPSEALLPEDLNKLLEPGYLPREAGWCILPNGAGYAASCAKMPGVTPEMNNWWGPWHERDDLRYKCWCPGSHSRVSPYWAQENVGMGLEDLYAVNRPTPDQFGFDLEKMAKAEDLLVMRCSNWLMKPADGQPADRPFPMALIHCVRKIPDGIEYRSRFYLGIHILRGKAINWLKPGESVSPERAYGMAYHGAYEMATLARLLPQIYPLYKDIP